MTIAKFKIGNRKFVVVAEHEYKKLRLTDTLYRQMISEEHALGLLAAKELKAFRKSSGKGISWEQVKKDLHL